ncbi:MAG: NAD(P)-dependent alcohol dehydrogenase [Candidatus Thorarchaeota archaeon]|jgi:NADPH:quinone reductase-like Zn-dependent oxidoreductase
MKAIVWPKYGPPDVLQFKEVDKPTPNDDEVLVKIHAASLNGTDFEFLRGSWAARLTVGPRKPKNKILGSDVSGQVEAVGRNIEQFQPGDEIMGDLLSHGLGAFAEFVCAPEKAFTLKPDRMTFNEAATYPQAAIIALQCLRGERKIQPGQKVLINGAGGGMGTFAVQIAKYYGAEVTGVDSKKKLDMVRSIGADHVIDYTQEDYTKSRQRYDMIIDTVVRRSIFNYRRALSPNGLMVMVGGSRSAFFQVVFLGPLISRTGSKKMSFNWWSKPFNKEDMDFLEELFESGKVVPVIDRHYPLSDVAEAIQYLEDGQALGKVVITMEKDTSI